MGRRGGSSPLRSQGPLGVRSQQGQVCVACACVCALLRVRVYVCVFVSVFVCVCVCACVCAPVIHGVMCVYHGVLL